MERNILHIDMDAFFAAVEIKDNPKLKDKPVIVGGTSSRGVVSTCSYEARKYGVHSAMPMYIAKQKCPHGIFLSPRKERYKEVSKKIFQILYKITDLVEPLSIDEAYLDVTNVKKTPKEIAYFIKEHIMKETGLTVSIGISYNKFLAKLASDWNKPNGLKIITKDMVPDILKPLSIDKVYGIGKKSAEKLNYIGIYTIDDLLNLSQDYLIEILGKLGLEIYNRIRGIDNRPVKVSRKIKSLGRETTLKKDTNNKTYLKKYLLEFSKDISHSLNRRKLYAKTITIKIKTSSFEIHTKSKTLNEYISSFSDIYNVAVDILEEIELKEPLRLIGLTASNFSDNPIEQLSFFDNLW
ncbi:DNA polymerase IV [Thermohalobacter berrensis]|uniref:DNA polymerase IV n=1 Tax=Thermohalobacter berrensis TaxID=99594 RepID=A0A419T6F7_9FIRM|nr:DNA polymerase IV [Thermohalobacter berrensis]RKD32978.1 DNA polymerase IV [Thermohalobacter berrensis]